MTPKVRCRRLHAIRICRSIRARKAKSQLCLRPNDYQRLQGKPDVSPSEPTANPNGPAIADAYGKMQHDPSDPAVKQSYDALKSEVDQQWDHAQQSGIKFEPWAKEGQPYANSKEMMKMSLKISIFTSFRAAIFPQIINGRN